MIASRMKTDVKKKLNIFNVYCNSCSNRQQTVREQFGFNVYTAVHRYFIFSQTKSLKS